MPHHLTTNNSSPLLGLTHRPVDLPGRASASRVGPRGPISEILRPMGLVPEASMTGGGRCLWLLTAVSDRSGCLGALAHASDVDGLWRLPPSDNKSMQEERRPMARTGRTGTATGLCDASTPISTGDECQHRVRAGISPGRRSNRRRPAHSGDRPQCSCISAWASHSSAQVLAAIRQASSTAGVTLGS